MNKTKKAELTNSKLQNHFHKNENSISWKIKFAKVFNQIKNDDFFEKKVKKCRFFIRAGKFEKKGMILHYRKTIISRLFSA